MEILKKGRNKTLIVATIVIIIIVLFFTFKNKEIENEKEKTINDFVQCLAQAGIVIYGSKTCPACTSLVNSFGGYEIIKPIYVECSEEGDRCREEMQTNFVPEIQIKGRIYSAPRDPESLGAAVGCEI